MSYKSKAANSGLLSYGINTKPDPIEVSPKKGNPAMTSLVITASNNTTEAIYCNKLVFSFTVGDLAQDLAAVAEGILVSAEPSDKWDISITGVGEFTAKPRKPEHNVITTDGISFHIFNIQTNKEVGIFTLSVKEDSSSDNIHFTEKPNAFDLGKFPYGFYMDNFAASAPLVKNGEKVTLTWAGSDLAAYTIYFDKENVDVTNVRSWLSHPLKTTTTFALHGRVQQDGQTLDTFLYVTVIVADPDFTATTLKVLKGSTLEGTTKVETLTQTSGDTTLNNITGKNIKAGETLTVTGKTTAKHVDATSLMVTGDGIINSLTSNTNLFVKNKSELNDLTVQGPFKAHSTFAAMKSPVLLASGTKIAPAYFVAKTDGFLLSYIGYPSDISKMSNTIAQLYCNGTWIQDLGGSTGTFGAAWISTMVANPSSMCIPVAAGLTGGYAGYQMDKNQLDSGIQIYWFAVGTVPAGESSFEMLTEGDFEAPPSGSEPAGVTDQNSRGRLAEANDFIGMLEKAFEKQISDKDKQALADLLVKL